VVEILARDCVNVMIENYFWKARLTCKTVLEKLDYYLIGEDCRQRNMFCLNDSLNVVNCSLCILNKLHVREVRVAR